MTETSSGEGTGDEDGGVWWLEGGAPLPSEVNLNISTTHTTRRQYSRYLKDVLHGKETNDLGYMVE